jgi:hypothetical protein
MSFYKCFDRFKKKRLFPYVLNLKIDVVLKAPCAIVIRRFSLNEAPLGLYKFFPIICHILKKINIFFYITKKV